MPRGALHQQGGHLWREGPKCQVGVCHPRRRRRGWWLLSRSTPLGVRGGWLLVGGSRVTPSLHVCLPHIPPHAPPPPLSGGCPARAGGWLPGGPPHAPSSSPSQVVAQQELVGGSQAAAGRTVGEVDEQLEREEREREEHERKRDDLVRRQVGGGLQHSPVVRGLLPFYWGSSLPLA